MTRKHLAAMLAVGWGGFVVALSLAACGGSPSTERSSASVFSSPTPTVNADTKAAPTPTPTLVSLPSPTPTTAGDLATRIARGEEIFQRLAGGVGCQYCHGTDAKGKIGPNVRGKPPEAIKQALGTNEQMFFISETTPLTEEDIEAIAAYLKFLESQP